MDHGEHCNYRSTLASRLGLRGGGEKERSTMPIKRASGGSIPKIETGGAFRNLGQAIKHDVVHADINRNAIKPARRYLDESMHKDDNGMKRGGCKKYANGGMPRPMYPAVMPPQGQQGRRMPPNAQSYAPQQPMQMKRGGKTRHYEDGGEATAMGGLKVGLGTRVKSNVETRHNFQNDGRMLAGKKEKSQYGAKERGQRKEKGLPTMAAGGIGKMRHEAMPKTGGSVNSPMRNRKDYM